jgi:hypothetical protein
VAAAQLARGGAGQADPAAERGRRVLVAPPPRTHPLARSNFAERANRLVAWSWSSGLSAKPPLDPEFLWARGSAGFTAADENASRDPADVVDFRERLAALCEALNREADLNALGQAMAYGQLKANVRTRHALGRMWREQPELARTPLAPPIIVVGQMRAGTTRMHRLLAADPRHCGTRLCNSIEPVPRRPDIRPFTCGLGLWIGRQINPWLDTLHPFGAKRVDAELGWLSAALSPCVYEVQWRVPSFSRWSEGRDVSPIYREMARTLGSDAAVMGNAAKPRVLKCPQYSEDLPALLAQFPDARVVVTRRDNEDVLASTLSVVTSQMAYQTDRASLPEIEAEWQRKLALREERMEGALAEFRGPLAEVEFAELNRDWRGAMAQVYAALGLELTPAALTEMEKEQAVSERSAYRLHSSTYRRFAPA